MKQFVYHIAIWGFIIIKAWGTIFATWSWWWLLLPFVPWIGFVAQRMGLLP